MHVPALKHHPLDVGAPALQPGSQAIEKRPQWTLEQQNFSGPTQGQQGWVATHPPLAKPNGGCRRGITWQVLAGNRWSNPRR
jgi:hypothetical protein